MVCYFAHFEQSLKGLRSLCELFKSILRWLIYLNYNVVARTK